MILSIYENTDETTGCYVALPNGTFAPVSLWVVEDMADTVWALSHDGTYKGVRRPQALGRILFQIINEEGHVGLEGENV